MNKKHNLATLLSGGVTADDQTPAAYFRAAYFRVLGDIMKQTWYSRSCIQVSVCCEVAMVTLSTKDSGIRYIDYGDVRLLYHYSLLLKCFECGDILRIALTFWNVTWAVFILGTTLLKLTTSIETIHIYINIWVHIICF